MNTPYCPNFSNKQVKAEFDELKDIFGEDEAYLLWDRNNGNSLDYAPNGALSKLFNDFLNVFNQDRKSALYAKRETLLRQFITTFGNWSKNPQSYYSSLDENGEPKISLCGYAIHNTLTKNKIDEFCKRLGFETTVDKQSDLIVDFTNKVITLSEYSEGEFNKILARVAAVLMPPKLRESVYSVGKKHGVQSVDDVYESILDAINNKDSWLKEDRGLFEKILDFLKNLIGKIFETQSYYEKLIKDATKDIIDKQSGWYKTVIQSGFAQKNIDFEKLKQSPNYHIYDVLTSLGAALDGSAAVRALGTLYRKGEEDFHDLDFTKKYDDFSWDVYLELLEFFLNYKTATNDFKNKDKVVYKDLRQQMLDNCTLHLKRHVIYKKLSQHYKDITVKHAAKTKELGLFVTLLVDGTPVDIFYSPSPVVKHNINGITVSDFSNAFAAKLIMGREKDIRDIINFHKFNKNGSINVNYGGIVFNAASEIRQSKMDDAQDQINRVQRLLDIARSEFDKKNTKEQRDKFVKSKVKEYRAQLTNVKKGLKFTGYQEFGEHGIEKATEEFENAFGDIMDFDTKDPVRIEHSSYSAPKYFIDGKHVIFNNTKAYRKAHEEYNSYLNEQKVKLHEYEAEINRLERQLAFYKNASVEQIVQKHGLYDDTIYDGAITIGTRKKLSVNAKVAASTAGVLLDDDYRAALISHLQNDNISYNDIEKNSLISLTDALFDYFKRSGIKVRLITAPYDANAKAAKSSAVSIIGKFATVYYVPQDNQESAFLTVLHELLHIATTNASPFDGEGRYINDELLLRYYNIFVANLSKDSEYAKYREKILNAKSYEELNKVPSKYRVLYHAAESAGEFLSSFINEKEVRDFVKTIKKEEQKSLFYYLHDLIKEFIDRIFRGADLIFTKNVLDDITDFLLDYNYHAEFIEQYADDDLLEQYEANQKSLEEEFSHSINYKDLINDNILPDDKLSFEDISSFNSGLYNFQTQNYGNTVLPNDNKKEHQSIWIIHNPNQVKSATYNNGMFSTENDDIQMFIGKLDRAPRQEMVSQLIRLLQEILAPLGNKVHGLADMQKYLQEHPNVLNKVLQFIGKKARTRFELSLRKSRPDMTDAEIKSTLDFLHSLEDNKENTAYIKTAIRWVANRSITLPQDNVKARQAFDLARKKHIDIQKYNTLGELITAPEMQPKEKEKKAFDPDSAETFSNKRTVTTEGGRVFTVYDVENTEEGQREVCRALAAHYEMSPWCLSTFTATGEPTESAKHFWGLYNALPRKIAYENGKPVAFNSDKYGRGIAGTMFRGCPIIVSGEEALIDSAERVRLAGVTIDAWKREGLVTESKIVPNALRLTEAAKKEIYDITGESWWDMEDTHPQEALSDSIVSEQRSMLRGDMNLFGGHELFDFDDFGFGEPFLPDPVDIYHMDVLNAVRRIVNEYILSYLRDLHLVPDGADEIYVRNVLTDRYISNNEAINDAIDLIMDNTLDNTPDEVALSALGQLDIFDNIRNTIRDLLQTVPVAPPEPPLIIEDDYDLPFFITPGGEVYGFVAPNGDIYLDETKISSEHPIHEYTHLWDRIVAKKNPKLWKRGVRLMKQTSLWKQIENDPNYGKHWKAIRGMTASKLESLIASEVHARLVGEDGQRLLDNLAKEKGADGIINKLKQWILDFWKDLKATFSNFSDEEIQNLTLEDFNRMTLRDFVYGNAITDGTLEFKDLFGDNRKPYEVPVTFSGNVELSEDITLSASTGRTIVRNAQQELEEIANNILKQFIKLYNAYERMPNISESRLRRQTKIYQAISELKDLHDAKSVEIALGYALLQLGEIDEDSGETRFASGNIYQWLLNSSKLPEPFSDVTTELLIDAYSLGIGFYKLLQNAIPSISSKYLSKEARSQISNFLAALDAATNIWRRALFSVVGKEMDKIIDERLPYSQEEKDMYKEVCRDWLAYNFMNGDITSIGAFAKNFGHADNPIIKMAFRLVQDAESVTQNEMYEKNAKLLHALHKCEKNLGRTLSKTWQTIFYEKDDKGVPTSYWVTEVNRGLYEKDYNEFIKQLNEKFDNVYGFHYIYDESGEPRQSVSGLRAEEETWEKGEPTYITYMKEIEKWKSDRINKPYTLEYYNEMYSEPYDGLEDPDTAPTWHKRLHGLSPKTLIRYNRIIENINHYLNICTDQETGIPHPEDLTDTQYANLENWKKQLEELQNPFTEDLHYKPEEDLKIAYELRAWSKWRNELFVHTVDMEMFERERQKVYDECAKTGDFTKLDKFLKYNSTVNVNPNFTAQTIGRFKDLIRAVREGESADVVRVRMNKAALDRYVKGDGGIEKDLSSKERNFAFWGMQKEIDLFLEDYGERVRDPEFAKMLQAEYRSKQIPYRDAYGTAYDVFMNPVPKDKEDSTELMSYRQYLINKFTNEAISTGKIIGYLDEHGQEIPISGSEDDIRNFVESLFSYTTHDEDPDTGLIYDRDVPLSIFSVSLPISDTFVNVKTGETEKTITTVPSERYSSKSGSSLYINYYYDPSKQSGELINTQFDNGRYDNSKEYNKIRKDKNLSELYDLIMEIMSEAYGLISSKSQTGNYLIPKVNASTGALFTRLLSRHGAAAAQGMWRNLAEVRPDDEDYIYSSLDNTNPDGSFGTNIPLKLLGVLDDKENYTSDVVGAVSAFAHMAINYREKSKILPLLQLMQYAMDDETRSWKDEVGGTAYIPNGSAQSLKMFNRMMSSHVYENSLGNIDVSKNKGWELVARRGVKAWQSIETLQMLSLNILSFTVGFCDSMFKNIHASLVGKYNNLFDFAKSISKAILRLPYMICNLGLQEASCKEIALMLLFGITKHAKEAMRNTNHARTNRILALVLMGGFTATDYFANFITLNSYLSNCKFIKGDDKLGIKEGFYTQYELKHLLKNNGVKNPSIKAFTLNLLSPVSLANAFEFKSFADANYMSRYVNETLGGINPFGKGFLKVKDKYKPYVTKKIMSDIRSKTLQRSALYNGMNPDNDKNQLTKNPLANIIFGMRRFIALNVQHLIAGGDDFSVREFEDVDDSKIKHGRERKSFTKKVKGIKKLTLELKNNRKSYNWETNTSEDQTLTGLYRALVALKDWLGYVINSIKGSSGQTKVRLGEVERYALRSTLIWVGMMSALIFSIISSFSWAFKNYDRPDDRREAAPVLDIQKPVESVNDISRYWNLRFIGNEEYKIALADLLFRTYESQMTGVNPGTLSEFITSATVYKTGLDQQLGGLKWIPSVMFGISGDADELVKSGGYQHFTKRERDIWKSIGPLRNLHSAFTGPGLTANLKYYTDTYASPIKTVTGVDLKLYLKAPKKTRFVYKEPDMFEDTWSNSSTDTFGDTFSQDSGMW